MLGNRRRLLGQGPNPRLMSGGARLSDHHENPMEMMGNLFDVAILIGVGFMVMALSSFGLSEILNKGDVTIVKNPGAANMEIITKTDGKIERFTTTNEEAQGTGQPVGTVYKLQDGRMVWVPDSGTGVPAVPPPGAVPVTPDPSMQATAPAAIPPGTVPGAVPGTVPTVTP